MIQHTETQRPASQIDPRSIVCSRCDFAGPHTTAPGAGPHFARLSCGQCGRFLGWLPKPRPVVQEGHA
jgi:hypothetical protein